MAIFIDTNIPIYAGGREHPLRLASQEVLGMALDAPTLFVTDAEVLQELLHRYIAIRAWDRGRQVFEGFSALMSDHTEPIYTGDVLLAASLNDSNPGLQARDLVHLAVMRRLGVTRIVSADTGFDGVPGVERLDPARFEEWRDTITE